MHPHAVDAPQQQKKSSTRNPKYNAAIRCHHLLRKAFQTLGQHLWSRVKQAGRDHADLEKILIPYNEFALVSC